MEQDIAELRRFVEAAWPRNPLEEPRVKRWLAAKRATLLMLLAFAGLQYYFFYVHLTIMALPRLAVAGPLS
ncbi:MAG TPA: hypothetical protein VHG88_00965 [Burkholderiales bacterium]|nr:hypothetical protein [Burkholderiales bacterium]